MTEEIMSPTALLILAKGFEETEAVAVIDVLRRADVAVTMAALEPGPVESAHGVQIIPDALLEDVADRSFDLVVLPGGLEGTERLDRSDIVRRVIDKATSEGKLTAAICAAPTVFEHKGVLEGRRATCHASMEAKLVSAAFVDEPVVVDGTVVTSRGVGTALAFGLELVSILVSRDRAEQIAKAIHFTR